MIDTGTLRVSLGNFFNNHLTGSASTCSASNLGFDVPKGKSSVNNNMGGYDSLASACKIDRRLNGLRTPNELRYGPIIRTATLLTKERLQGEHQDSDFLF